MSTRKKDEPRRGPCTSKIIKMGSKRTTDRNVKCKIREQISYLGLGDEFSDTKPKVQSMKKEMLSRTFLRFKYFALGKKNYS